MGDPVSKKGPAYFNLNTLEKYDWTARLLLGLVNEDGDRRISESEFGKLDFDHDGVFSLVDVENIIIGREEESHPLFMEYCLMRYMTRNPGMCDALLNFNRGLFFADEGMIEKAREKLSGHPFYRSTFTSEVDSLVAFKARRRVQSGTRVSWYRVRARDENDGKRVSFEKFYKSFREMVSEYNSSQTISDEIKIKLMKSALENYTSMFDHLDWLFVHMKNPSKEMERISSTLGLIQRDFEFAGVVGLELSFERSEAGKFVILLDEAAVSEIVE